MRAGRLLVVITALAALAAAWSGASAARVRHDVRVVRVPSGGLQPQVKVDDRGVLHLLYFAGEPRAGDLFYTRSTDFGATFAAPVRVNTHPGSAIAVGTIRGGQLALGAGGRVHVAWNGSDAAVPRGVANPATGRPTAPFLYAAADSPVTRFSEERNLMQASYDLDGGGDIAADRAGRVYAVWHANGVADPAGEAHRQVWIARSPDQGATFARETAVERDRAGACGCCGLSVHTSERGGLDILFRSVRDVMTRDVHLLHADAEGSRFTESTVGTWQINACPMSSMAIDASGGRVRGAWESAGQVYFSVLGDRGAVSPSAAPGEPAGRKHPRLATAATGDTLLVWTEGTAWARGGSLAWRLFDADGRPSADVAGAAPAVPAWSFAAVAATPTGFVVIY